MDPRSLSSALRGIASSIDNSKNPSRSLVAREKSKLVNLISASDSIHIPPPPEDSNPKLDYATKMAALYEDLLNGLKPGGVYGKDDPNYKSFKHEYEEQLNRYKLIIRNLSGVDL